MDIHPTNSVPSAGALRLVNSGNRLQIVDPNGVRTHPVVEEGSPVVRSDDLRLPYDGTPTNYAIGEAMTGRYIVSEGNELTLTYSKIGIFDPFPQLSLIEPTSSNNALYILADNELVVAVSLATDGEGVITTTLDELIDLLYGTTTLTAELVGDGDTVCISGDADLTGGRDTVPGTPAIAPRLATDGTDVWVALVTDTTITQASWAKLTLATA